MTKEYRHWLTGWHWGRTNTSLNSIPAALSTAQADLTHHIQRELYPSHIQALQGEIAYYTATLALKNLVLQAKP